MDLGILLDNQVLIDIRVILHDHQNEITIDLHKSILYAGSVYFQKLFTFHKNTLNELRIFFCEVPNAFVAYDIIMSFYGRTTNIGKLEPWRWLLESVKCYDFFGMTFDRSKLVNIEVPKDGIGLLMDVATSVLNFDDIIIDLIIDNIPAEYDLTTIDKCLVQRILKYYDDNYNHNNILLTHDERKEIVKIWDIESGKLLKILDNVLISQYSSMCVTHNNKFLLFSAKDHCTINIYDIKNNKLMKQLDTKLNYIRNICISSDKSISIKVYLFITLIIPPLNLVILCFCSQSWFSICFRSSLSSHYIFCYVYHISRRIMISIMDCFTCFVFTTQQ